MNAAVDPIRRLPRPAEVHAHIGHLLRELRIARQLLRVTQSACEQEKAGQVSATSNHTREVNEEMAGAAFSAIEAIGA